MRQVLLVSASRIRSSWQRGPINGMGRECCIVNASPCWRRRSRYPASIRAPEEIGGVLILPLRITSALSLGDTRTVCHIWHVVQGRRARASQTRLFVWVVGCSLCGFFGFAFRLLV